VLGKGLVATLRLRPIARFPLTPTLSLGERERRGQRVGEAGAPGMARDWPEFSLSPRERVGVRGKWAAGLLLPTRTPPARRLLNLKS